MIDGNGGGSAKEQVAATCDELRERVPEFAIPKHRTFVVRKLAWTGESSLTAETTIEAHIVQPNEHGMVCFYDLERNAIGEPAMRLHRVFYQVEEVEEVMRMPPVSRILAH